MIVVNNQIFEVGSKIKFYELEDNWFGKEFEILDIEETGMSFMPYLIKINTIEFGLTMVNPDHFMLSENWNEYIEYMNKYTGGSNAR